MAVGRAKSPTVFLNGRRDHLPDQTMADGERDCLRGDMSKLNGVHSVDETGPLMARRFCRLSQGFSDKTGTVSWLDLYVACPGEPEVLLTKPDRLKRPDRHDRDSLRSAG